MIIGGVGLGICSSCNSPGAFWYPTPGFPWPGVWICDSCQHPEAAQIRIPADIKRIRWY